MNKKNFWFILSFFALFVLSSCATNKNTTYFKNIDSLQGPLSIMKFEEPVILVDDILAISINTIDSQNSASINLGSNTPVLGSSATQGASQQINGFLVDKNGEIEISMIGKVKVQGLTTFEARELIRSKATQYYNDPTVQVRFANFKITVLGEVNKPATYTLPNEKVSILDVLGLAGDLSIYGMRENILVIRDVNGKKESSRLNLNSTEIFNSPFYYLRQNDVVYVEPNKSKIVSTDANRTRLITVGASITSALLVLLIRVL